MIRESWMLLGAQIVGAVFIAAALLKVAAPASFHRHINRLGLLPYQAVRLIVPVTIGVEAGWGAALVLGVFPHTVLPLTIIALVLLTGLTWWSVGSGKTEDCGCYGGFLTSSIGQSVGMNALYLLLIAVTWAGLAGGEPEPLWKIGVVLVSIAVIGGTAEFALRSEFSTGVPFFTPSPLKIGRRWKPKWAGPANPHAGDQLVSYLGPNCPYCKQWVRVLNVIHASPALPPVTAVLASSSEAIEAFVKETGVRFPISTVSEGRMQRLASAVPTTILVEKEMIQDVWIGQMSEEFVGRFKRAFFPLTVDERIRPSPSN